MTYDRGLVARVADALEQIGEAGARQRGVFGGRGFLRGSRTFVIVWEDGLLVRLSPAEAAIALKEPGVSPFAPDGERPSRSWVIVGADAIADDPELVEWVRRALRCLPN